MNMFNSMVCDHHRGGPPITRRKGCSPPSPARNRGRSRHRISYAALLFLFGLILMMHGLHAQAPPFQQGWVVATCFPGYINPYQPGSGIKDAPVMGVIDVHAPFPSLPLPSGSSWMPPMYHGPNDNWTSGNLGVIFGIAIDKRRNIYVAASSAYGNYNGMANAWGPAGPGGIYKLSGLNGSISTLTVSGAWNDAATGTGTNKIPNGNGINSGVGIGNICYAVHYDKLYATNMEDGKIYIIDPSLGGTAIVGVYDPVAPANPGSGANATSNPAMTPDATANGFAPLGERLWAIGYNPVDRRLYYGVWMEDLNNNSPSTYNIIRSVGLTGTGIPIGGTDRFEIRLSDYSGSYSMPPSDIAFSSAGKMAVAERGWPVYPDPGVPWYGAAHRSRVLQYTGNYTGTSVIWSAPQQFFVGMYGTRTNSAGGIDYGYGSYDKQKGQNIDCDSVLWMSGDFLFNAPFGMVYGLQRTPASGNTFAGYSKDSYFIDLNGVGGTQDKNQIGDVEICRDSCGVQIARPPCDLLRVAARDMDNPSGVCCKTLTITNNYQAGYFHGLRAEVITPGVSFTSASVTAPAGWGIGGLTPTSILWTPPSPGIPLGSTTGLSFCLDIGTTTLQQVVISWMGRDGIFCRDTLRFNCVRTNTEKCFQLDSAKITCTSIDNSGGYTFVYTFNLKNISPYDIDGAQLYTLTPGATVHPPSLDFLAPIPPGGTRPVAFTITGPNATPGTGICFGLIVHDVTTYPNGFSAKTWCCTDTLCLILPECLECCRGFRFGAVQKTLTYNECGNVSLTTGFSPGPGAIISASATIVSASLGQQCPKNGPSGRIYGDIVGGLPLGGLNGPSFSTPPIESGYSREIMWGTNPSGVVLSGATMTLNMIFPEPPSSGYWFGNANAPYCRDTLRFCVRYRFTDVTCRTCDTLVCYQIIRGSPFICLRVLYPRGDIFTRGPGVIPDTDFRLATIAMSDANNGTLRLTIPPDPPEAEAEEKISIVGMEFEPAFGVRILSLQEDGGPGAGIVENIARLRRPLEADTKHTFTLRLDNYGKLKAFSNRIGLRYLVGSNRRDTLTGEIIVEARTPEGKGGDTLTRDVTPGEERRDVRTYALKFTGGNRTGDSIATVIIRTTGEDSILAIGPGTESNRMAMHGYASDSTGARWLLTAPADTQFHAGLAAGGTLGPIYVTVAGTDTDDAVFLYETYTWSGDTVSTGEVRVRPFTSGITRLDGDDGGVMMVTLADCRPNPLTGLTTISFRLAGTEPAVWLTISDLNGREVARLIEGSGLEAGEHQVEFDGSRLPGGTYYYTLRTRSGTQTRVMQVVR